MLFVLEPVDEKLPQAVAEERLLIGCKCVICNKTTEPFHVYPDDFEDWQNGKLAQVAFPYLAPNQREILISEICPSCFPSDV